MILIECSICNRRELASVRRIERLENTSHGIVTTVRCSRGHLHQSVTGANHSSRPSTDANENGLVGAAA